MKFNAWQLGRAWNSVALAQGEDKGRPALYRTTLVEMYHEGIRLVSTDSYLLLKAWVPNADWDDPEPGHDELPVEVAICQDIDRRVTDLMRYAQKISAKDGIDTPIRLTLQLGSMKPGAQGTLDGMVQSAVAFRLDHEYDEVIEAPVFDGAFPGWRQLWFAHEWKSTGAISFGADGILRLGKLSALWERAEVRFELGGQLGVAKVSIHAPNVNVSGLVMPVRSGRADESSPEVTPVPPSEEGISHEYSEALDSFLADVLATEVADASDDPVVEAGRRAQVIRAGNAALAEGQMTALLLANSLGIDEPRALDLIGELVAAGILDPQPGEGSDPLYTQARRLVVDAQLGSAALLQRKLKVGFARAAKLIDELLAAGVVGPVDGVKAKPVLMTVEELAAVETAAMPGVYTIAPGAGQILLNLSADDGDTTDDPTDAPDPGDEAL